MTAFTRSVAGDQPRLVGIDYDTNRNYDDPDTYYDGVSPGVLSITQHLLRSLAGNQPTETGSLNAKRVLAVRVLLGNQPAASGLRVGLDPGSRSAGSRLHRRSLPRSAQYTSSVRP
jgi:pSer/pThr/pTyr-binding forkhead associated (FHA) protein